MSDPRSILIIRLSAMGDIIMATPLIPTLKQAYPEARLVWLTDEANAGLLRHNPRLDKLLIWPRRRWRELARQRRYLDLWREFRALVAALRQERFDLVLDIQGLLKSGVWAFLSGGKTRIGIASREGSQFLMTQTIARDYGNDEDLRIGSEYLKLARALGLAPARFDMDLVASEQERQEADALLREKGVSGPFAVICPFTTRPQKHWLDERWAQLAGRLSGDTGLPVVMLGGPGDESRAEPIASRAHSVVNLVGQTSLGLCIAIVQRAGLLVGVDTGLTHLGIAMATPTVAVFGSTRPYLDPASERAKVLYEPLQCAPCERHPSCGGEFTCMKLHTVDEVLAAAASLIEKNQ